jgi:hypothetical protein
MRAASVGFEGTRKPSARVYAAALGEAPAVDAWLSRQRRPASRRDYSGSPALRRPSSNLARSSGRRCGPRTSLRFETRRAGSSCWNRTSAFCACSRRPATFPLQHGKVRVGSIPGATACTPNRAGPGDHCPHLAMRAGQPWSVRKNPRQLGGRAGDPMAVGHPRRRGSHHDAAAGLLSQVTRCRCSRSRWSSMASCAR